MAGTTCRRRSTCVHGTRGWAHLWTLVSWAPPARIGMSPSILGRRLRCRCCEPRHDYFRNQILSSLPPGSHGLHPVRYMTAYPKQMLIWPTVLIHVCDHYTCWFFKSLYEPPPPRLLREKRYFCVRALREIRDYTQISVYRIRVNQRRVTIL